MDSGKQWTRRRFLGSVAASGALNYPALAEWHAFAAQHPPQSQRTSPEIISGRLVPLLESNVARPLRYTPKQGGFSIRNGDQFFNRPLYGPNIPFRVDGGDLPEFSLYLPGHGGNLRLAAQGAEDGPAKWLQDFESVTMYSLDGRLRYELRDPVLGAGALLVVEAVTAGAALWVEVVASGVADGVMLDWAFGGVSGRKGRRNGDIGCEDEPVSEFFHLRPSECEGNAWTLPQVSAPNAEARVEAGKFKLALESTAAAEWRLGNADAWDRGWSVMWNDSATAPHRPVLLARTPLSSELTYLSTTVLAGAELPEGSEQIAANSQSFASRRTQLEKIAQKVRWSTPDPFFDSVAGALCTAADAIWDERQGCVMHGAVAWRVPFAGWRGPYCMDVLGDHGRMQRHLRHWIARQNTAPVSDGADGKPSADGFQGIREATGAPDPGTRLARTENLLHSAGDLSHSHYDMNLVFFDALLRHVRWTGDLAFARETWPALELHAAWERRLFRRDYGGEGRTAPLYEAYAAIWASDNLQYNGGGAAHSSAYNVFLNRGMAELAEKLGLAPVVAQSYRTEADTIVQAMREHLWMPERGAFAESREWLGERRLAEDPAVWTLYHTIDSEVTSQREAWQMLAERLRALRKVPVRGAGVPEDAGWLLACSDWQPYVWSLTLLVLAENLATALAFFQGGMADEGWQLLRGSLLGAGFRGLCPGNFPMSLQLDPHRQESQRDFGDPIGCASRTIIEGLWGVRPHVLAGALELRPQLPLEWERAELQHPEVTLSFARKGDVDVWIASTRFRRKLALTLRVRARSVELPQVTVNGKSVRARFVAEAVGEPLLEIADVPAATSWQIEVQWQGAEAARRTLQPIRCKVGEAVHWPAGLQAHRIDDPQGCVADGRAVRSGGHTVFLLQEHGACRYWMAVELQISEVGAQRGAPITSAGSRWEHIPMGELLTGHAREILSRGYASPRPGLCSLNLPDTLLGGWANFDSKAVIDDTGVRRAGGVLEIDGALSFAVEDGKDSPNCCYLSHWDADRPRVSKALVGRARRVHLLLVGTTFPQATRSCHADVTIAYAAGPSQTIELRSPNTWWPVEQDYLVDEYVFRLDPVTGSAVTVNWRVDLRSGKARRMNLATLRSQPGGPIPGGSAFIVSIDTDAQRELASIELHTCLYGIVLGWMGMTVERA